MIFGHGLERHAPPKISVNLNVPLIPARVGGITPAFFFEQLKERPKEIMAVPALLAPKKTAAQGTENALPIWQMFMCLNDTPRCPFEMQPGEITRPPSDER